MRKHPSAARHEFDRRHASPPGWDATNPLKNATASGAARPPLAAAKQSPALSLTAGSAIEFSNSLEEALRQGAPPVVVIEAVDDVSPDFLIRVIEKCPQTYVSGKAFMELAQTTGLLGQPGSSAMFRLAVLAVLSGCAALLISRLFIS